MEIDEELETQIVVDSEGPPPCKVAKKSNRVRCEGGSSTDADIDGMYTF